MRGSLRIISTWICARRRAIHAQIIVLDLQRGAVHAFDCAIVVNTCLAVPGLTLGHCHNRVEVACLAAADSASTGVRGQEGSPSGGAHMGGATGSVAGQEGGLGNVYYYYYYYFGI